MATTSTEQEPVAVQVAVAGGLRTFAVVASGQFVSILGSSLSAFGLAIWVFAQTRSVTLLSLIILAAALPGILVAPLAGSVADRHDRRRVMLLADAAAGLTTMLIALSYFTGQFAVWQVFVLAAVGSLANAFQEPAYMASVPLLVPKRHLGRASGVVQFSQGLARIATPLLAGAMIETVGIGTVLLVDVATFLVAVTALLLVRFPRPVATEEGSQGRGSLWGEAAAGWAYLRRRHGLMALLILFFGVNFLVAFLNVLYIPLIMSFASAKALGATLTIGGVGMMAGSILVMALGTPRRKIASIMALIALGGVVIGLSGVYPSVVLIAACGLVMMFVLPILQASSQVLWQTKVAPDVQGRVLSLRRMLAQASLPAAYILAGPLADRVFEPLLAVGGPLAGSLGAWIGTGPGRGIGLMFILMGLGGVLLAGIGWAHPRIRRLEREIPDMVGEGSG